MNILKNIAFGLGSICALICVLPFGVWYAFQDKKREKLMKKEMEDYAKKTY